MTEDASALTRWMVAGPEVSHLVSEYEAASHLTFSPGCVHPLLNVALFMIFPLFSVLCQSGPCGACVRCDVIPPPEFLSASASLSASRLPLSHSFCPSVIIFPH